MATAVRVAVVGLGDFGRRHARSFARHPDSELVAVVGRDAERTSAFAAELGSARAYTDLERMLEVERPDAVAIATPGALHLEMAVAALAAGCAVLLEKPVVPTIAEIAPLRAAAEASRGFVVPAHVLRFAEPYREVERRIREGRIGAVRSFAFRRFRSTDHDARFPDVHPVYMTAIHDIDLAVWFGARGFDHVSAVSSTAPGAAQPSTVTVTARTASGAAVSFSVAWLLPGDHAEDSLVVLGTEGMISLDRDYRMRELSTARGLEVLEFPDYALDDALDAEIDHFIRCASSRTPSDRIALDDALLGLELAEAAVAAEREAR